MWRQLERLSDEFIRSIDRMDSDQWIVVSVIAVILGVVFLRGFGSRTSY